jgi:hypothetical protein
VAVAAWVKVVVVRAQPELQARVIVAATVQATLAVGHLIEVVAVAVLVVLVLAE